MFRTSKQDATTTTYTESNRFKIELWFLNSALQLIARNMHTKCGVIWT